MLSWRDQMSHLGRASASSPATRRRRRCARCGARRRAKLFQPFNRPGAEGSEVEGTGIGLVLSRQLAQMMGAELTLSSRIDEVTVASLPLARTDPPAGSARRDAPAMVVLMRDFHQLLTTLNLYAQRANLQVQAERRGLTTAP